jgi:predicted Zn-dependent protease
MEINDPVPVQEPAGSDYCQHCGSAPYEEGYKVKLCSSCRRRLSRYPVKKTVLWSAMGVGLLVLLSMARFPKAFNAGLNYERAVKLEAQHKYMSAEAALRQTLHDYPEYMPGSGHFMIAAYYNNHLDAADSALNHWAGRQFNDEKELIEQVNDVLSGFQYYRFKDTAFSAIRDSLLEDTVAYRAALLHYTQQHPDDKLAGYLLADTYFDAHNYAATDSICEDILKDAPDFQLAYGLLAASYREEKSYEQAIEVCNRLLKYNAESVFAHTSLVKILLKQKQDKKALEKALYGYNLEPSNTGIMQVLALAYHFNKQTKERDALLARLKQNADTSGLAYIQNVIAGTIPYRD